MFKIEPYHKEQAKKLNVSIQPSDKGYSKIDVFKDGKYVTSIGDTRYNDFISYYKNNGFHYAMERRKLYHQRHAKDNNIRGFYAKNILW